MINDLELLCVVDENNNPIGAKPRHEIHAKHLWHRVSHIWVFNSRNQILCQKRTMLKDIYPGKWEAHLGGHMRIGEDYIDNALKETKEEIGLPRSKKDIIFFKVHKYKKDKEFQGIFYTRWDGEINELVLEKEEVENIKWVSIRALQNIFKKKDTKWVHHECEKEILDAIIHYSSQLSLKKEMI
ncbi:MAG: NUDIX hydrolase [Candidatus Levyibacteriota bacterium]